MLIDSTINKNLLKYIIIFCSITQVFVHLIFFLHLENTPHQTWNLISLIFTVFIVFILVLGSIWIMTHLHHNLMI
ncbi:cytochrome o ubiquinol oxidase subunit IV [Blochmannia endosymbiont of Camponotus nipponensis]|uniref:cytochrome o ubiquinol oxidase subunit IV n=1 Tax=Blochmannia endosymbiont of Camponotus nipponensis TaxID=2681986 RepID=UPI001F00F69B|nr:cytochrome o ubiquinol oxidase subunit IV [Blochmannia endosymbiont of Camponotus nipponensis]